MHAERIVLTVLAFLGLAGCGGSVRVIDRTSGAAVADASVTLTDAQERTLLVTHTSGSGIATVGVVPADGILTVSAPGYRPWGAAAAQVGRTIALEPLWLDAFMDGGRATVGQDAAGSSFVTPRPCPCDRAR